MSTLLSCYVSVNNCKSESVSCCKEVMLLVLTVKTAVSLGKHMYQSSLKIKDSLAFTNNVKSLHYNLG